MSKVARTKDTGKYTERPYVANYPPLNDWLRKHESRCNWQLPLGDPEAPTAYVESHWLAKAKAEVIVVVRANQLGWDLYTPSRDNSIMATLEDAEKRLGLS